jgi:hypothetical protein
MDPMIHLTLPLHMGALHPFEQALVALVAFGPFVVLFAVVYVVRRRDLAEEAGEQTGRSGDVLASADDPRDPR